MKKRKSSQLNKQRGLSVNAINTLGYNGEAKIEVLNSNNEIMSSQTLKNHGTAELCEYICNCMIGFPNTARMPGGLMPCKLNKEDNRLENILDYCIRYIPDETAAPVITNYTYTDDNITWKGCKYTLTFNVHSSLLAGVKELNGIRLYSLNYAPRLPEESKMYAEINFKDRPLSLEGIEDCTILFRWTLTVSTAQED